MRIALVGNPNSGKTTMYNALTGKSETVGNWAGVTVDFKEHPIRSRYYKGEEKLILVDLPGAYSMTSFTFEEKVTGDYIKNQKIDAIINIVDATNLSRSLFFTTEIIETGIPVVVALNKTDVNEKKETKIDTHRLSERLGCPVIETVSTSKRGLTAIISEAVSLVGKKKTLQEFVVSSSIEEKNRKRYEFVKALVSEAEVRKIPSRDRNKQDKFDAVITNKFVGIPIFAVVMFLVFWLSQSGPGLWIAEGYEFESGASIPGLVTFIDMFGEWVASLLEGANPFLSSLLVDGIIGGVGAVVGFLPLVMVMYFLIALLEDSGYMARATVVLDPIFKKVGLSGRSVIPFVIGTGCAVPGVMACRTIRDERERRATAMLAPFMPCGAKLPVISLFAGSFFGGSGLVGALMYFLGILIIILSAFIINGITGYRKKSFFIIELPEYKAPSATRALKSMCQRGWAYIVKAGTVILVCNFAVHVMQSFTLTFSPTEVAADSILATVSLPFSYLFAPVVGVVMWQLAAATITGFIAKENVVGTLAVAFIGLENVTGEGAGVFTTASALAFLILNLFTPPCFAAIGAMNAELKSKRWLFGAIGFQLGIGYSLSFLVYFFGTLLSGESFGEVWMPILGFAVVIAFAVTLAVLILKKNKEISKKRLNS